MSDLVVVEVGRRGKLVVGDPYFDFGVPLVLDRKGLGDARPGDLAVVRTGRGRAKLERVLGRADDIEAVLEALLVREGLRAEFEPHTVPEPSLEGRADLRDLVTFTIDPETAKDFDDALSFREEDGGIRVWVHIADVSYFVPAGSPLDHGAADRAFSTYVPGRVAPMLPPSLSEDACSLRPHVDRLTVTVEVPFGPDLEMRTPLFYRSVIRSDARLAYGQAERLLAGEEEAPDRVVDALRLAERVATELRRRRFARGALRIETPEINFAFDGRGGVERAWLEHEPHAHMLVEEHMILANEAVGALLAERRAGALFRIHEAPDPQAVLLLLSKLADLEVPTPPVPETERLGPRDAARLAAEAGERAMTYARQSGRGREALPALVLRALKQARYDPSNLGHSGLASRAYGHFTSPIRRYPDLVCHRALLEKLGVGSDGQRDDLPELAAHASERERAAAQVEYLADELCLAWLLESELLEAGWESVFEGEVIGVIASGLFVRFGEVFEGFLPARLLPDEYYEMTPLGTALEGRRTRRRFRLGDPVDVRVEEIRKTEGKVSVSLPESGGRRRRT